MTYSDFDKTGVVDIVEYHRDKLTAKWCRTRPFLQHRAMPFIGQRNESSTLRLPYLEQVYGECLKEGFEANVLEHTVFLSIHGPIYRGPARRRSSLQCLV